MSRKWEIILFLAVALILLVSMTLGAQNDKPVFAANDRQQIETYYNHLAGTLAPGSLDRSAYSLGVEKALHAGSHVPMQLEKNLELLPSELESKLTPITGDYARYKLGTHVVLVRKADLEIADILKNVAVKSGAK